MPTVAENPLVVAGKENPFATIMTLVATILLGGGGATVFNQSLFGEGFASKETVAAQGKALNAHIDEFKVMQGQVGMLYKSNQGRAIWEQTQFYCTLPEGSSIRLQQQQDVQEMRAEYEKATGTRYQQIDCEIFKPK